MMNKEKNEKHDNEAKKPAHEQAQPEQAGHDSGEPIDIAAIIKERDEYLNLLKRQKADYVNYQKRMEKDKQSAREMALREFMTQLTPAIEDIKRGLNAESQGSTPEKVLEGLKLAIEKLNGILKEAGLECIETVGAKFDPCMHEAVMQEFRDDLDDMTVCEELHGGYSLKGTPIMPAKVKVARKPQPPENGKQ